MMRSLSLLLILLAAPASSGKLRSHSDKYTGSVVDLEGKPVEDVRIRFGEVGNVLVLKGGEFQVELGMEFPYQIQVESLELRIVSPVHGVLATQPPKSRIEIVLGRSIDSTILTAMARESAAELQSLKKLGLEIENIREFLRSDVRAAVLKEIKHTDDELLQEIKRLQARTGLVGEIGPPIDAYIRELRDLRDQFELCLTIGAGAKDRAAIETLRRAIASYSTAFTKVSDNRSAYMSKVEALGPDPKVDVLRHDFHAVLTRGLDDIHKDRILQLNTALLTLQKSFGKDPPSREEVKAASDRAVQAAKDLREPINTFDKMWQEFKINLERW